jgi:hypothetical protein
MVPNLKDKKIKKFPPQQFLQEQPSRAPAKKNILPLKECYIDDTHYDSNISNMLEIFWLSSDKITIKSNKAPIFGPSDIRVNADSLIVSYFYLLLIHLLTCRQPVS